MRRLLLAPLALCTLGACTSDDRPAADEPACKEAISGRVTLVAEDLMWDTDCLQAPAGALTIVLDNQDDGVNHDVHLPDAPGSPSTDLIEGPATIELEVTLDPGTYQYVCDIHPNMVGTLTVGSTSSG